MIKDTAGDAHIEYIALICEVFEHVSTQEGAAVQLEDLLDDEALKERFAVCLDCYDA